MHKQKMYNTQLYNALTENVQHIQLYIAQT